MEDIKNEERDRITLLGLLLLPITLPLLVLIISFREVILTHMPKWMYNRGNGQANDLYDMWTSDGILEHYWGKHIHLGYYNTKLNSTKIVYQFFEYLYLTINHSFTGFKQAKYDLVMKYLPVNTRGLIYDVGCGIGETTRMLKRYNEEANVFGITISEGQIHRIADNYEPNSKLKFLVTKARDYLDSWFLSFFEIEDLNQTSNYRRQYTEKHELDNMSIKSPGKNHKNQEKTNFYIGNDSSRNVLGFIKLDWEDYEFHSEYEGIVFSGESSNERKYILCKDGFLNTFLEPKNNVKDSYLESIKVNDFNVNCSAECSVSYIRVLKSNVKILLYEIYNRLSKYIQILIISYAKKVINYFLSFLCGILQKDQTSFRCILSSEICYNIGYNIGIHIKGYITSKGIPINQYHSEASKIHTGNSRCSFIWCCEATEHAQDRKRFIGNMLNAMEPNGSLRLFAWTFGKSYNDNMNTLLKLALEKEWGHSQLWTVSEYEDCIKESLQYDSIGTVPTDISAESAFSWRHNMFVGLLDPLPVILNFKKIPLIIREICVSEIFYRCFLDGTVTYTTFHVNRYINYDGY